MLPWLGKETNLFNYWKYSYGGFPIITSKLSPTGSMPNRIKNSKAIAFPPRFPRWSIVPHSLRLDTSRLILLLALKFVILKSGSNFISL